MFHACIQYLKSRNEASWNYMYHVYCNDVLFCDYTCHLRKKFFSNHETLLLINYNSVSYLTTINSRFRDNACTIVSEVLHLLIWRSWLSSFPRLVSEDSAPTGHCEDGIEGGITLTELVVVGRHFLPFSNTGFGAAIDITLARNGKYFVLSRPRYVVHLGWCRDVPPPFAIIDGLGINRTATVDSVHEGITAIDLLQTTANILPRTGARFLAFEDLVTVVHSPYVAVSTARYVLQSSANSLPSSATVDSSLEDLMTSVHPPHLFITSINLGWKIQLL